MCSKMLDFNKDGDDYSIEYTSIETNKKACVCIRAGLPCMLTHVRTRRCAYDCMSSWNLTARVQSSSVYLYSTFKATRADQSAEFKKKEKKKNKKIKNKIT